MTAPLDKDARSAGGGFESSLLLVSGRGSNDRYVSSYGDIWHTWEQYWSLACLLSTRR